MTSWGRAALATLIALTTAACAMMPVRTGTRPRVELVETTLAVGKTRRGQVLEIMGPPDGAGLVSLPMHPEPRAVWNYIEQDASWDEGSMYFLSLFFDDQVLTGYLWFTIEDLPIDNSAPESIRQAFEK
jgi:hypothetical protein